MRTYSASCTYQGLSNCITFTAGRSFYTPIMPWNTESTAFSKPLYTQGRVYAVNESTLYVEGFSYDGTGEEARFYAGRTGEEGTLLSPSGEPAAVLEQLENRNLYLRYFHTSTLHTLCASFMNYILAIYAPMIYTAPCIVFLMRADPLRGQMGGGWALEIERFLGPLKWHQANRRVPFGAKKLEISMDQPPHTCLSNGSACIKNPYVQRHINHRCIGILCTRVHGWL